MATDFLSVLVLETIGILILFTLISWLIVFVNDNLSRLGTYHSIKTKYNSNGEGFVLKLFKVFLIYISLFLPTYFSIYISLKFLQVTDVSIAGRGIITLTPLFTIVFLILMRHLMNPTINNIEILLKFRRKEPDFEVVKKAAETFKERILTFFSSYISLTLIVFVLYLIVQYYTVIHNPSGLAGTVNLIVSQDSIPDQDTISTLTISYIGLLVFFMFWVEIGLFIGTPIIQASWNVKRPQKPLTVETFETFGLSKKDLLRYRFNHMVSYIRQMPSKAIAFLKIKLRHHERRDGNT
ncbi:MAG: hypothetical protein WC626_13135 [Methanoregula sp.]